jgi:hypothetical protein
MRVGVSLLVGVGILVITGACSGPGANDDACTSEGNVCIDLSSPNHPACPDSLPQFPCNGSGPTYTCCTVSSGEGGKG